MSVYESSITNPKKQLEFYKQLSEQLQQENQQLKQMVNFGGITITNCPNCKKEITVNFCRETENYRKKYLNAVADYEMVMSELQELKKQLEEYKNSQSCSFVNICKNVKIANYNQQKEFIKYLEDYLNLFDNMNIDEQISYDIIEEILQKYKETIGVSDDKTN